MRMVMMLFYLVLILLGVSFAALNANSVHVNFYVTTVSMPVSILMTLMFGVGMVGGFFIFALRYWRLRSDYRKLKSQLKLTEIEIKNLRTIPVTDNYTGFGDHL